MGVASKSILDYVMCDILNLWFTKDMIQGLNVFFQMWVLPLGTNLTADSLHAVDLP